MFCFVECSYCVENFFVTDSFAKQYAMLCNFVIKGS